MEELDKIKKQITDLRMDYDELTDWVSQLHHKLDNHIREHKKHAVSILKSAIILLTLLGATILLTLLILSCLKMCGIV